MEEEIKREVGMLERIYFLVLENVLVVYVFLVRFEGYFVYKSDNECVGEIGIIIIEYSGGNFL